jgi:hypothetical protein
MISDKIEETKGVARNRQSKNRQYNGQNKKRNAMAYRILHRKLKIGQHEPHKQPGGTRVLRKGRQFCSTSGNSHLRFKQQKQYLIWKSCWSRYKSCWSRYTSKWMLFNIKWAFFTLYHGKNISYSRWNDDDEIMSTLY